MRITDKEHAKMKEILDAHGMVLDILACGCCDSPSIYFEVNNKVIADSDGQNFRMTDADDVGEQ